MDVFKTIRLYDYNHYLKTELLNRLLFVSKIISTKNTLPIMVMDNILLDIQDGTIKITATDHHDSMNISIEGILTDNNISICIEPKLIIEALKKLPEQPITITINDNLGIRVKYKGGKFELTGMLAIIVTMVIWMMKPSTY